MPAPPADDRRELVARIHASPTMVVLAVTGGGVAAIVDLLAVPGASRTVLEASVPYAGAALADLVGAPVDQATSAATAAAMAEACRRRAEALGPGPPVPVAGVACTAALVTDRPRRGEHRAHLASAAVGAGTRLWTLALARGARDRTGEDRLVSDLVLAVVADACGLAPVMLRDLGPGDALSFAGPRTDGTGPLDV
jgi:hypothetical protein